MINNNYIITKPPFAGLEPKPKPTTSYFHQVTKLRVITHCLFPIYDILHFQFQFQLGCYASSIWNGGWGG